MNTKSIIKAVTTIERKGTRAVSFDYKGKTRNVIIGAYLPNKRAPWNGSRLLSRSLVAYKGGTYLVPRVMNDNPKWKAFDVKKIENFSFKA